MPVIPPALLDVVVAVGVERPNGSTHWAASGFLYNRVLGESAYGSFRVRGYLVTNRHVVDMADRLTILMNPRGTPPARAKIDRRDPLGADLWAIHPDADVDVAVTGALHGHLNQLGLAERLAPLHSSQAYPVDRMRQHEISEGDPIYVAGYPMGLVSEPRARPIVRLGSIARVRDLYDMHGVDFWIDAHVFPGNSGGPVFLPPQVMSVTDTPPVTEGGLLGIVRAYLPYRDFETDEQTGARSLRFQENSGIAVVHTVDCIDETIDVLEARYPLGGDQPP